MHKIIAKDLGGDAQMANLKAESQLKPNPALPVLVEWICLKTDPEKLSTTSLSQGSSRRCRGSGSQQRAQCTSLYFQENEFSAHDWMRGLWW